MQIVSTYAPAVHDAELGKDVIYAVYDTFVDGKGLVVGLTVGTANGQALEDIRVREVGQRVLNRFGEYLNFRHADAVVVIAGVATVGGATERVRKVLAQAPKDCGLLLLCANDKIYDKAFTALNINLQAMKGQTQ